MSHTAHPETCKVCEHPLTGKYCTHCGRPAELRRINGQYITAEIATVLNLKKGFLYTAKELLLRPGKSMRGFIHTDRQSLLRPVSFLIISSLIYTLLQHWLRFEDGYVNYSEQDFGDSTIGLIMIWISNNYGFANILMAVFIAFWYWLFYRKYKYNMYEILIVLCYVIGMLMLMFAILGIVDVLTQTRVLDTGSIIVIAYLCWAVARFFDGKKKRNYVKAVIGYLLGMISFFIVVLIGGGLVDKLIA